MREGEKDGPTIKVFQTKVLSNSKARQPQGGQLEAK